MNNLTILFLPSRRFFEELKPDVIIVWGYGLFDRLYGLGETDGEEMSLTNGEKVYTRWFSIGGDDKALMIRQHHTHLDLILGENGVRYIKICLINRI